jgi:hypothetical protein
LEKHVFTGMITMGIQVLTMRKQSSIAQFGKKASAVAAFYAILAARGCGGSLRAISRHREDHVFDYLAEMRHQS